MAKPPIIFSPRFFKLVWMILVMRFERKQSSHTMTKAQRDDQEKLRRSRYG